ncbi:hypothetical protein [Taibaiella koreensis]|uniref:hypothetical protein n=1 Tax=Taibaiella koreensis TaxID=1268548 RepID=UPI000E59B4C5|nr:hypothetical protein [Taibaiella koreensis]
MDHHDEQHRRYRDECDGAEDIKATVGLARSFVEKKLMTLPEALKYFNLPLAVYEQYAQEATGQDKR